MHLQTGRQNVIQEIIDQLLAGSIAPAAAVDSLTSAFSAGPPSSAVSAELGDVTLDIDRQRRCGYPEVVYGEGKTAETIERVVRRLMAEGGEALVTRVTPDKGADVLARLPEARYNATARTLRAAAASHTPRPRHGRVTVVTAGTSDLPVAEEAHETLDWMGVDVTLVHDVGVAGPHRLPAQLDKLRGADAIVVAAGMEGALPSVVGGYVDCPVIAVPTSVGYGAAFGGLTALLGMLNSCAANVVVVNIDAGFKAGYVAGMIAQRRRLDAP